MTKQTRAAQLEACRAMLGCNVFTNQGLSGRVISYSDAYSEPMIVVKLHTGRSVLLTPADTIRQPVFPITADTITDEQINDVGKQARADLDAALVAMTFHVDETQEDVRRRMVARGRCAEILNAAQSDRKTCGAP